MQPTVKGVRYRLLMRRDNGDESRLPQLRAARKHNEPLNTGYANLTEAKNRPRCV